MPDKNQLDYICGLSDKDIMKRFKGKTLIDEEIRAIMDILQTRI